MFSWTCRENFCFAFIFSQLQLFFAENVYKLFISPQFHFG